MEIVDFLLARLDEDEAAAKAATPGPWTYRPGKAWFPDPTIPNRLRTGTRLMDIPVLALYAQISEDEFARARYGHEFVGCEKGAVATTGDTDNPEAVADARHIARHDPARVLADVAAKRAILRALITQLLDDPEDETARWMVQTLALSYADHPDYREAWRPA